MARTDRGLHRRLHECPRLDIGRENDWLVLKSEIIGVGARPDLNSGKLRGMSTSTTRVQMLKTLYSKRTVIDQIIELLQKLEQLEHASNTEIRREAVGHMHSKLTLVVSHMRIDHSS
jgi:hypothetical protein